MAITQPNIIVVVGEDTGRIAGCYGDPLARTPNLDRLAASGCRYDQAYATSPVCAPSRSALASGRYPMRLGTHHMRSTLVTAPRMFTQELRDAGYHVSWPTKLDFNFEPADGWCDDTDDWIDRLRTGRLPNQPWFGFVNLAITHESSMWPDHGEYQGRDHLQHWDPERPRPPRITDPAAVTVPPYLPDTPRVRSDMARHYDNLAVLDGQVGEILDALDESGHDDDTIVFYLADHGRGLPREKRWPYTAGIHMPLLVRWPGVIEAGSVSDRLVSWVDIAPTILSMAGVATPDDHDGFSFLGVEERDHVVAGRDRMDETFDRVRVVRTATHHYVRNFFPELPWAPRTTYMENMATMQELRDLHARGELVPPADVFMQATKPHEELYELSSDPWCVNNVVDDHPTVRDELASRLDQFLADKPDLAEIAETELISTGVVVDRIGEYRARVKPLPPHQDHGWRTATTVEDLSR